jgi:putative Mn2+ efflux pump MntP
LDGFYLLGIAIGLAMDALAVALAAGVKIAQLTPRHVFRVGFHFGLFQFLMPVVGWLAGSRLAAPLGGYDQKIAGLLLLAVGAKMLWEACRHQSEVRPDPTRGLTLIALSVATSLDALAVGLSMAFLKVNVLGPSLVIGLVAGTLASVGVVVGNRVGQRWGRLAEVLGGAVLLGMALRITWGG